MIKPITRKNEKVASQEAERKEAEIRNKEFYLIGTETVNIYRILWWGNLFM